MLENNNGMAGTGVRTRDEEADRFVTQIWLDRFGFNVVSPETLERITDTFRRALLKVKGNRLTLDDLDSQPPQTPNDLIVYDQYSLNTSSRVLTHSPTQSFVRFTPLEGRLMAITMRNHDLVVPHDRLAEYVWNYDEPDDPNLVKTHIFHVRVKLSDLDVPKDEQLVLANAVRTGYLLTTRGRLGQHKGLRVCPSDRTIQNSLIKDQV